MITFQTTIQKFQKNKEKTGWTYIEISTAQTKKINPGVNVSYRVKGLIDQHPIQKTAILPMGNGGFILPFNAAMRKATGKDVGDKVKIQLELDERKLVISPELIQCLKDEPGAYDYFKKLTPSHQGYFSKWIESAKTIQTKSKRILIAVVACSKKQDYGEMIRSQKKSSL